MTRDLERRLDRPLLCRAVEEDEEFAEEFSAQSSVLTSAIQIHSYCRSTLAFNEGVLGASLDEESGVVAFHVTDIDEALYTILLRSSFSNTEKPIQGLEKQKRPSCRSCFSREGRFIRNRH